MVNDAIYQKLYKKLESAILSQAKNCRVIHLSGGLDSRIIAGIIATNCLPLKAVTLSLFRDTLIARKICQVLGLEHYQAKSKSDYKYTAISGSFFDEINGCQFNLFVRSQEQFDKNVANQLKIGTRFLNKWKLTKFPVLNKEFMETFKKTPFQLRKWKRFQKWILKNKFPMLNRIPYANSMLPAYIPYPIHLLAMKIISFGFSWLNLKKGSKNNGFTLVDT